MIRKHFLSNENRDVIYQILEREISKKDALNISEYPHLEISKRLRGLMQDLVGRTKVDELKGNPEEQITQLNTRVLKLSIPGFSKMIRQSKHQPQETDPLLRRNQVLSQGKINRVDQRPIISSRRRYSSDTGDNQPQDSVSVDKRFTDLQAKRQLEMEGGPRDRPTFTDETDSDQFEDASKLFERLEKERKDELRSQGQASQESSLHAQQNFHPSQTVHNKSPEGPSGQSSADLPNGINDNPLPTLPTQRVDGLIEFEKNQDSQRQRDEAFTKRLDQLQAKREQTFKQNLASNESTQSTAPTFPQPRISQSENLTPETMDSSIFIRRNQDFQKSHPADVDPTQLHRTSPAPFSRDTRNYQDPSTMNNVPSQEESQASGNLGMNLYAAPKIKEESEYTLVINASDRKWYGEWSHNSDGSSVLSPIPFPNRYNFPLKFDPSNGEAGQVSIKRNFRNITQMQLVDVILSAHDNPIYIGRYGAETIGAGMVLTEPQNSSNSNGQHEDEADRDDVIEEVEVEELVTPYLHMNLQNLPYLCFNIQEFSGSVYSTNSTNSSSLARMIVAKQYLQSNNRKEERTMSGFVLLTPHNGADINGMTFRPTPLASLDLLNLRIERPDGQLYGSENPWNLDHHLIQAIAVVEEGKEDQHLTMCDPKADDLPVLEKSESESEEVESLDFKDPSECHLEIYVDPPFHPTLFKEGDQLLLKSVEFLQRRGGCDTIREKRTPQQELIRNYLTSKHGVYSLGTRYCRNFAPSSVQHTENKVALGFCNVIMVSLPFQINRRGHFQQYKYQCSRWLAGGNILNQSIQPVITISLKTQSPELTTDALQMNSQK